MQNLVLTEDDYRTFPRKYAPFVATVQAALTEHILCLMGFPGDDPNFLAWTGWLRDEMRSAVPNTYFFTGAELKPFQRKLLERRHIIPIPLKRICPLADFDYRKAYLWLCTELARPPDAPRPSWDAGPRYAHAGVDPNIAPEPLSPRGEDWIDTAIDWRRNRERYQGWYVMYRDGADRLWQKTEFWISELGPATADAWTEPTVLFILHELVWRWSTALQPLHDIFVFSVLDPQMKRYVTWRAAQPERGEVVISGRTTSAALSFAELDTAYRSLLLECFRHAREIGDDVRFLQLAVQVEAYTSGTGGVVPHRIILHSHMQVGRCDADVRMPSGISHFRQRSATGQCMADERVATVVDRQRGEALRAKYLAGGAESLTEGMSRERLLAAARQERH